MDPRTKDLLLTVFCAVGAGPWVALLIAAIAQPTGDPPWARWLILGFSLGMLSPFSMVAAIIASVLHLKNEGRQKALKYSLLAISSGISTAFMIPITIGWFEYAAQG